MKWNAAQARLAECEADLRLLLADAANEGDYASVQRIAEWAKAVAALVAEGGSPPHGALAVPTAARQNSGATTEPAPTGGGKSKAKASDFPQFYRRGDELVKVGWSKKERKRYSHRAGRRAIVAVSAAVRQIGVKGRMFTGDKLLPLKDPTDSSRIADYQAYVALAWFKHLGIVEQHGRKSGYTLVADKQIDSIVTAAWPELAEWRG
jgi:hypothetical protein